MGTILGTVAAMIVGGAVAAVTVVGVVSSQTRPQGDSPANVNAPVVQYGATQ